MAPCPRRRVPTTCAHRERAVADVGAESVGEPRRGFQIVGGDSRGERHDRDAGGVLAGAGEAEADPGKRVVARASVEHDAGATEQREREREQRGGVVERVVPVEDGQEGDREERRREQPDAAVEEAGAEQVEQPDGARAEQRDGDPRDEEDPVGVQGVFADDPVGARRTSRTNTKCRT